MTLITTIASGMGVVMVGDRLVSLAYPDGRFAGEHDSTSNKLILYRAVDGLVVFGYTGRAYLDGIPTDQWLASHLCGFDPGYEPVVQAPVRWNYKTATAIWKIREALRRTPEGNTVEVIAAGYRSLRFKNWAFPFLSIFSSDSPTKALNGLGPPQQPGFATHGHVGAYVAPEEIKAAADAFARSNRRILSPLDWREVLTSVVQNVASRERSVGEDVMQIVIHRDGNITCRFESPQLSRAAIQKHDPFGEGTTPNFTPWLIGQTNVYPPFVVSPGSSPNLSLGRSQVCIEPPPGYVTGTGFFLSGQIRRRDR